MKNIFLFLFILSSVAGFSQRLSKGEIVYMSGTLIGPKDTITGYFGFDNSFTTEGQSIRYKKDLAEKKAKIYWSHYYLSFESGDLYMEAFPALSALGGKVIMLFPRVSNGKLQLFEFRYQGAYAKNQKYFIKKGDQKIAVTKNNFKDQMKELIGDNPALYATIENGSYKFKDLPAVVNAYNAISK